MNNMEIKIGQQMIKVNLLQSHEVIYIVKFKGQQDNHYTLIAAPIDAQLSLLQRRVYLKDCNVRAPFWAPRSGDCEFKNTGLPIFSNCLDEYSSIGRQIIEIFN